MREPLIDHHISVGEGSVYPQGPLKSGVDGDHNAVRLVFSPLDEAYSYRLEVVTGAGGYDVTPTLFMEKETVTFTLPCSWTAAGTAAVRLVQLAQENGEEVVRRHYPPVLLQFDHRDEGCGGVIAAPLWQEYLTKAEQVMNLQRTLTESAAAQAATAAQAAAAAEPFAAQAEEQAQKAEHAATVAALQVQLAAQHVTDCESVLQQVETLCGIADEIKRTLGVE